MTKGTLKISLNDGSEYWFHIESNMDTNTLDNALTCFMARSESFSIKDFIDYVHDKYCGYKIKHISTEQVGIFTTSVKMNRKQRRKLMRGLTNQESK